MTFRYSENLKTIAVIICVVFLVSILVGIYVGHFRFDKNLRWIYDVGKSFSSWTFLIAPLWGLVNGIWIIVDKNIKCKDFFIWVVLSLAPISYILVMTTYTMLRSIN